MEQLGQEPGTLRHGVSQEESACGVVLEEDQVFQADGVENRPGSLVSRPGAVATAVVSFLTVDEVIGTETSLLG